jgi:hypothetical protein
MCIRYCCPAVGQGSDEEKQPGMVKQLKKNDHRLRI